MIAWTNSIYRVQAKLCLEILSLIRNKEFALKGGTAINFFIRPLPRLSVDIDLTYTLVNSRKEALEDIFFSLNNMSKDIQDRWPDCKIGETNNNKRYIRYNNASVKIEVSELRGTILPVEQRELVAKAQEEFEMTFKTHTVALSELYAGKICAALSRQHPRDLFDIKLLLENEGITDEIRQAFVVYLVSHNRPMHELLQPNYKDLDDLFENHFQGMTRTSVTLDQLIEAREQLVTSLNLGLNDSERQFILSIQENKPDWHAIPFENLDQFPAIKWKLLNLEKNGPN